MLFRTSNRSTKYAAGWARDSDAEERVGQPFCISDSALAQPTSESSEASNKLTNRFKIITFLQSPTIKHRLNTGLMLKTRGLPDLTSAPFPTLAWQGNDAAFFPRTVT